MMKVKEIFYSLQGEGRYTGKPAIFIRFAGCNLKCPFCDTDFRDGKDYTEKELVEEAIRFSPCRFVVLTGGEPTLQVTPEFVGKLKKAGFYVAMETNGTHPIPDGIDWVTLSPKIDFTIGSSLHPSISSVSEVKVVYTGENNPSFFSHLSRLRYIQPCDTGDEEKNRKILASAIGWLALHPDWNLSLQTQKIINVR